MKKRGFEIVKGYENKNINIPVRKTSLSAGYDIESAEEIVIPSFRMGTKPTLIKTGLKCYMENDEYLMLVNRSSNPVKRGLVLANSVGIIDADYYNNPDKDGHLMYAFYNYSIEDITIRKGDTIGQAIFMKYLLVDNDSSNDERKGGFGSTDKE